MLKTCSKCTKTAVTFIRYNGTHLCKDHFVQYFEKRVKKDIKKQGKTRSKSKIGIALSGGKDSTVTLHVLHSIFANRKDVELCAITVDEGIAGYRPESIGLSQENCKMLDVKHYIVSFRDIIGRTMDEIASLNDDLGECTYCGVFRRLCLNKKAKELDLTKLATGHNLDDVAQSILMNFVNGDMEKMARLGPHAQVQPGLVPRMLPLRSIPEKEVALYAIIKNIHFHHEVCPYSVRALRGRFRNIIDELEYANPGTRHSILSSYDEIKDLLIKKYPAMQLNKCRVCGASTSQDVCKACLLLKRLQ